jgi:hypothetical protein
MRAQWLTWFGLILTRIRKTLQYRPGPLLFLHLHAALMTHLPISRGAGYTFGSGVVHKFLDQNKMSIILRAHQLCMEGFSTLFDGHLSTVWSAPNYCYRCGNSASVLEISPGGSMVFNVFEAAPENERDGPSQQAAQNAGGKVRAYHFEETIPLILQFI